MIIRGHLNHCLVKWLLAVGLLATVLILTACERGTAPPPAITGLIATDASDTRYGKIDLTWSPSDAGDFAYYAIYASEVEITDVTELSPVDQVNDRADVTYRVTRYRIPGLRLALMDGTEYWFAVTAVDLAGNESKAVTSISATPIKIEILPPPPPRPIPTVFVTVAEYPGFSPVTVTVSVGDTVAWTNVGTLDYDMHTVISDSDLFDSGYIVSGDTFSYTFTEVGVFGYHCELDIWETGKVIVE